MYRYAKIIAAICSTSWAIMPEKMNAILGVIRRCELDSKLEVQIDAASRAATTAKNINGTIAVLPLRGTIAHRIGSMAESSGGISAERFGVWFDDAVKDSQVGAIVMDIDSPGGDVAGVTELSQKIFDARGSKPIIAVANSLMASAAFWIGSAADEIVVTPSGRVGSIGVVAVHTDQSGAEEQAGFKTTLIRAGKHKVEANPHEPLSDEAHASIQSDIDAIFSMFVGDVARNRDVTSAAVRGGFGEGRVVNATTALAENMADRVASMDDVIARLVGNEKPRGKSNRRNRAKLGLAKIR